MNSTSNSEQHAEVRESPASTLEDVQSEPRAQSSVTAPPASVASLLSQLRTPERTSIATNTPTTSDTRTAHQSPRNIPQPSQELPPIHFEHRTPRPVAETSSTRVQDIRSISFQQALPHLAQLASDPGFLPDVSRVRFIYHVCSHNLLMRQLAAARTKRTRATVVGRTTSYTQETRGKGQSCSYQVSM